MDSTRQRHRVATPVGVLRQSFLLERSFWRRLVLDEVCENSIPLLGLATHHDRVVVHLLCNDALTLKMPIPSFVGDHIGACQIALPTKNGPRRSRYNDVCCVLRIVCTIAMPRRLA